MEISYISAGNGRRSCKNGVYSRGEKSLSFIPIGDTQLKAFIVAVPSNTKILYPISALSHIICILCIHGSRARETRILTVDIRNESNDKEGEEGKDVLALIKILLYSLDH